MNGSSLVDTGGSAPRGRPAECRRRTLDSCSLLTGVPYLAYGVGGTAAVPISDVAEAADVSWQVVHPHFGDRDTSLLGQPVTSVPGRKDLR